MSTPSNISLIKSALSQDPYPFYNSLFQFTVPQFDSGLNNWIAFNYDDAREILESKDFGIGTERPAGIGVLPSWLELSKMPTGAVKNELLFKKASVFISGLFLVDEERHYAIKREIMKVFNPEMLSEFKMIVNDVANEALIKHNTSKSLNIKENYATPIVYAAVDYLFGFDSNQNKSVIAHAHQTIYLYFSLGVTPKNRIILQQSVIFMANFFIDAIHKKHSGNGRLWKKLLEMYENGILTADELITNALITIGAATETTIQSITNVFVNACTYPAMYKEARNNRELIKKFVVESNRMETPGSYTKRVAQKDIEIAGVSIKKGEEVMCLLGAANRDPKKFENPNTFSLTRPVDQTLTFGAGSHYCIGAILAKMELEIALENFMNHFDSFELVEPIEWEKNFRFRGVKEVKLKVHERTV